MNVRFEVDDINLGLGHLPSNFDIVHARLISTGIQNYAQLIAEAADITRPNGLIDLTEFDFNMYDAMHRRIVVTLRDIWGEGVEVPIQLRTDPVVPSPPVGFADLGAVGSVAGRYPNAPRPWADARQSSSSSSASPTSTTEPTPHPPRDGPPFIARWFCAAGQAARCRGADVDAAAHLYRMVSSHPAYERTVYREFWLPYGPFFGKWPEFKKKLSKEMFERVCRWGDVMGEDILVRLSLSRL